MIDVQDASIYEYVLTELEPGTFYEISVLAYNDNGEGPKSEPPANATTDIASEYYDPSKLGLNTVGKKRLKIKVKIN